MRRVDNAELKRKVLDHLASQYKIKEVREVGHLSSYVTCRTRSFFDQKQTVEPSDEEVMLFALGFGLQDVLTPRSIKPLVYEKFGIIFSPDMPMSWTGNLGEIKTTRKSAKYHFMEDALPVTWADYMMAGCYIVDTDKYDLIVLYMSGNFAPPFPQIYAETIYFDKKEIDTNWQKVMSQKEVLDKALVSGVPPESYKNCYDFECRYCRYGLVCDTLVRADSLQTTEEQIEKDKELWQ